MTVALLVNMLYSVVDRIYLGHIPGEGRLALTGIGLAFPIIAVISAFQRLCSDGGAPLCAMARGAGELERAETIQGNAYTLLLLFSLLLIALGYAFKAPILWATGAGEATFPYADAYLRIYLVGTIFVLPSLGMNAFITGQGFPTVSMMTVLLGAVVNILLDPLFIFVFDMGVQGAALATVIAQFTSFLWVLLFLTSHRAILRLRLNRMRLQRIPGRRPIRRRYDGGQLHPGDHLYARFRVDRRRPTRDQFQLWRPLLQPYQGSHSPLYPL